MADSARWERVKLRPDDVIITTPSKCGTTWTQQIVGMLLRDNIDLPPIGLISPWLDMQIRTEEEIFGLLEAQQERRFIKTHTPFDGIPYEPSVTYICVIRHPLDVALSDRNHMDNMRRIKTVRMRNKTSGKYESDVEREEAPQDPADYLRWFIDNHELPSGSGPYGLEDYCQQIRTYWDVRSRPNVHLFHYADMWSDLDGQMRRIAAILGVAVDESRWPQFVEAATLESMRARSAKSAPDAHLGLWKSTDGFFSVGGTRDWGSLLTDADKTHFDERLHELARDAYGWVIDGRRALAAA